MFDISLIFSLNILIFSPVLAGLITASPLFGTNPIYLRRFTKTFMTIHFLYTILFVVFYNINSESFYDEIIISGNSWLSKLGINAAFGADGFTILLCAFSGLVFLFACMVSKTIVRTKFKLYYTLVLFLYSIVLGIFCAKDMFVFLLFWQAELIPMYLLISQWGDNQSDKAATRYVLYNFTGSILLTLGMIALYYYGYHSNGTLSSSIDFLRIYQGDNIFPLFLQKFIFWCFFIGFAIKIPVIPVHKSFTLVQSETILPITMISSCVLVNTALYGLIRFNLDLFPELFLQYAPILMLFALINILWASLSSLKQKNIKKIGAYISIVYSGFVLLGLSAVNQTAFNGALFLILGNFIIISALTLIIGYIQQYNKTKSLQEIYGIGKYTPRFMNLSYIVLFSVAGVPLTLNFFGLFNIFTGAFSADFENALLPKIVTVFALFALFVITVAGFNLLNRIFCGINNTTKKIYDITGHRLVIMVVLCFLILIFGIYPDSLSNFLSDVTDNFVDILRI